MGYTTISLGYFIEYDGTRAQKGLAWFSLQDPTWPRDMVEI